MPSEWTEEREIAAQLVAKGEVSYPKIAAQVGIGLRTLARWTKEAQFSARVNEIVEACGKKALEHAIQYVIASVDERVGTADLLRAKLLRVVFERAEAPEMQLAAGGKTGVMVRQLKMLGSGPLAHEVEEFAVDTALVKSITDVQEYAARELGQWKDKAELSGAKGGPIPVIMIPSIVTVKPEEMQEMALPTPKKR